MVKAEHLELFLVSRNRSQQESAVAHKDGSWLSAGGFYVSGTVCYKTQMVRQKREVVLCGERLGLCSRWRWLLFLQG